MSSDTPWEHGPPGQPPPLGEGEAEDLLRCICFKTGPPRKVGVELEWLIHDRDQPHVPVPHHRLDAAAGIVRGLPLSAGLTFEPGGQLELSSRPAASLMACIDATTTDLTAVRDALDGVGLVPVGFGVDPWHPPRRLLREPRYDAMEVSLDRSGPAGRAMMCTTASVQVCLDAGEEEPGPLGYGRRWQLSHLLGAVLVAAFANSSFRLGRPTPWRSARQSLWADLDPWRPLAPPGLLPPRDAWAAHVLDTPVMCIREEAGPWSVPERLTFREWIRTGAPRPPVRADLDYHISTLFPPVRPRGHLELRMIDAQHGADGWLVPLAVTTALFDDPEAAETVYRTVKPLAETAGAEAGAAQSALGRRRPRRPGRSRTAGGGGHLLRGRPGGAAPAGCHHRRTGRRGGFNDRFVARGRCPADDLPELLAPGSPGGPGRPWEGSRS